MVEASSREVIMSQKIIDYIMILAGPGLFTWSSTKSAGRTPLQQPSTWELLANVLSILFLRLPSSPFPSRRMLLSQVSRFRHPFSSIIAYPAKSSLAGLLHRLNSTSNLGATSASCFVDGPPVRTYSLSSSSTSKSWSSSSSSGGLSVYPRSEACDG